MIANNIEASSALDSKSNADSSSSGSTDPSLLHARIAQLESELSNALIESQSLKFQLMQTEESLADEQEVREELLKANKALSDEIEELTRSLFVEANDMVERESKARFVLEARYKKLESEFQLTREQLAAQTQQLLELRQKLVASKSLVDMDSDLAGSGSGASENSPVLTLRYYDDLFPSQKFSQRRLGLSSKVTKGTWEAIIQEIPDQLFVKFTHFVELASLNGLAKVDHQSYSLRAVTVPEKAPESSKRNEDLLNNDEKVLNHEMMRSLFETDIEPCLRFNPLLPIKSHSFLKKLAMSFLSNTCSIERLAASEIEALFSGILVNSHPTSPSTCEHSGATTGKQASKKKSLKTLLLNLSVTSLPEQSCADSCEHSTESEQAQSESSRKACSPRCSLCKSPFKKPDPLYRFRLSERDSHGWFYIDASCRNRIVSVGDFYTFVRHIRRGLHSHRPIADLYCELLHYLRNMFYSRLGATAFYIKNDAELLLSKLYCNYK